MSTREEQEQMAVAIQQLNAHLRRQETAVTILAQERERLAQQVQSMSGTGRTARAGRSGRHTSDWQTRLVRRRSDEVRGLVAQNVIVPRSRGPVVSARVDDDRDIVDTETQRSPRQRRKRTQQTDVLHSGDDNCRSRVGQVSQCWRGVRGLVCGTPDERAGVQILRYSNQTGGMREKRARPQEPVHKDRRRRQQDRSDDAGNGRHASERAPHRNSVRITSWNQMQEEIFEITRTHQYIDNYPMPMQLGVNPKSKGKDKDCKG